MPRRTNDFQRLIFAIEQALAGADDQIVESAEISDRTTDEGREVDFVITHVQGPRALRIGVECRDHRRKQSVEWVEQLVTKRSDLRLDRIVAVSSQGFTPAAHKKATAHGVETLTLTKAITTNWRSVFDDLSILTQGVTKGTVTGVLAVSPDGQGAPVDLGDHLGKIVVHDLAGNSMGTLHSVANQLPMHEPIRAHVEKTRTLGAPVPVIVVVNYENGARLTDASGVEHTFSLLQFFVNMVRTESEIPFDLGDYGPARVAVAKMTVNTFRFALAGVQQPDQDAKFLLVNLPPEKR